MIFLYIAAGYLFLIWVVLRLTVPHMGYTKKAIPEHLSPELESKIAELKTLGSQQQVLERAYEYVTGKYVGGRIQTITHFWRAFGNILEKSPGFLPCNGQSFLMRTLLIKSGRYSENDIRIKTVPLNLFIHQYLQVLVDGTWTDVDAWSHFKGLPIGKKTAYFG